MGILKPAIQLTIILAIFPDSDRDCEIFIDAIQKLHDDVLKKSSAKCCDLKQLCVRIH